MNKDFFQRYFFLLNTEKSTFGSEKKLILHESPDEIFSVLGQEPNADANANEATKRTLH